MLRYRFRSRIILGVVGLILFFPSASLHGRIIYLAIDHNDVMNVWMVDLAALDRPEQITTYTEPGTRIYRLAIAGDGRSVVFLKRGVGPDVASEEVHLLDLQTRSIRQLTDCAAFEEDTWASCSQFSLSSDGRYVAYYLFSPDYSQIRLIDLESSPHIERLIYDFDIDPPEYPHYNANPNWVGNTHLLTYSLPGADGTFQQYDVDRERPIQILPLGFPVRVPYFSPGGSRYAHYNYPVDLEPGGIAVRLTDDPAQPISEYVRWDLVPKGWVRGTMIDWNSDNRNLLINISFYAYPPFNYRSQMAIFDTTTGDIDYLPYTTQYADYASDWNSTGDLILFQRIDSLSTVEEGCYCDPLMIYNVRTGGTTPLGLTGWNPMWVESDG